MKQYRIGIDAGGTKVAYGLFNKEGDLIDRHQHPTPAEADGPEFSDLVIENVRIFLARNHLTTDDLIGIGACMPSFFLFDEGYVTMTSAMVNIRDFAIRDYFQERLGVPVVFDNDGNVAALAEHRYGAGRGRKHMVYVATSTGLGSGLILNNQLFRGTYGWAGECGHMIITPDEGIECGCRNMGCFQSWTSGLNLPRQIRKMAKERNMDTIMDLGEGLDAIQMLDACKKGDALAMAVLEQAAKYLGICMFNIYQLLNVNLFVFGGGLVHFGPLLYDRVRAEFDRLNHNPRPVDFRFAELKQDFGIIGAAELVND